MYHLTEADGDFILETFYKQELQKVTERPDRLFRVENVLKAIRLNTILGYLISNLWYCNRHDMIRDNDFYVTPFTNSDSNLFFNQFQVLFPRDVTPTNLFERWKELGSGITSYCIPIIMVGYSWWVLVFLCPPPTFE